VLEEEQQAAAGEVAGHGNKSLNLFTSIITSTEQQATPPTSMDCPRTPVGLAAVEQLAIDIHEDQADITAEQLRVSAAAAGPDDDHAQQQEPTLELPVVAATAAGGLDTDSPSSFAGFDAGLQFRTDEACSCGTPTWISKSSGTIENQASPAVAAAEEPSAIAGAAAITATPVKCPAQASEVPAVSVTPAAKEWLQLVVAGAVSSSHVPTATPRSRLKQPERTKSGRYAIPNHVDTWCADTWQTGGAFCAAVACHVTDASRYTGGADLAIYIALLHAIQSSLVHSSVCFPAGLPSPVSSSSCCQVLMQRGRQTQLRASHWAAVMC